MSSSRMSAPAMSVADAPVHARTGARRRPPTPPRSTRFRRAEPGRAHGRRRPPRAHRPRRERRASRRRPSPRPRSATLPGTVGRRDGAIRARAASGSRSRRPTARRRRGVPCSASARAAAASAVDLPRRHVRGVRAGSSRDPPGHRAARLPRSCRNEDDAIAGLATSSQIVLGDFRSAYLGYSVFAPFDGKGYMTEGLRSRASGGVRADRACTGSRRTCSRTTIARSRSSNGSVSGARATRRGT